MSENIVVPTLGESITEATVSKWIKNQGDQVKEDEPIVELETDKVNVEVPSPAEGVISKINFKAGDTVEVGALLGTISSQGDKAISSENVVSITRSKEQKKKQDAIKEEKDISIFDEKESNDNKKEIEQPLILNQQVEKEIEQPLVLDQNVSENKNFFQDKNLSNELSPAVRKIVDEKKIDLNRVQGTGKGGRILKGDLINLMDQLPQPSERKIKYGLEEVIKMTKLRLTIAKRLKEAQENAAILTTFNEVDMSSIAQMRKDYQENFQRKFSVKLGLMSFFVKASIAGLKFFPAVNAEIRGENIVYKNYYNIGFAVGTDRGLVVPVLKNADEMSFANIEKNINTISDNARNGKLAIQDLQGGTFTISNGGVYGSMLSTPILNPPQSGVLGMHNIVERPISKEGEILSKPIMYLALSYDHRIIDGKDSVSFLKCIKEHLEEPERLFSN
ncbi:MAG TPA: 2-oxoglutarate dehydrogenase complex dihydrolipoyllysine-residue succinyltransferase [Pelagibacteraceae bacterium]|nr:2-oxoglutarate dehydrogenase complex dihydrolipoyllysine-residue succinyltransferase [Pelagibacteraceae bacterium]